MSDVSKFDRITDEETEQNPREYFLAAWEQTLQDVKEQVEEEREAEAETNRRAHRHGRRRLVTS